MTLLTITIILFILYSILIIYYWLSWKAIPLFNPSPSAATLRVSIIIPARNEEEHIGPLLAALDKQSYPRELTEIIVIDDHSEDRTAAIVQQYPGVRLVTLKEDQINSYKKKAIETGIGMATGEWMITTDADCIPGPGWVATMVRFKEEKNAVFITAPVVIDCNNSVLEIFQAMDFMVLQGITGASVEKNIHAMCNGANLGYERESFYTVNGFSGIDHIASGDDMLLMYKIWKEYPGRVHYLKSGAAIVSTQPMKTWKDFFRQRIRWASKARLYDDKRMLPVLLLVYLFNLSCLALAVSAFWYPFLWKYTLGIWVLKTLVELPFFFSVAKFFHKTWATGYFFFFQPLHIIYTVASGLFGQSGSYQWKGRTVK